MHTYILEDARHTLVRDLARLDLQAGGPTTSLALPARHDDLPALFLDREDGIVWLPALWEDLQGVKLVREFQRVPGLFEAILCGPAPDPAQLAAAFNEGLGGYLELPPHAATAAQLLARARQRLETRQEVRRALKRLAELEVHPRAAASAMDAGIRDRLLGRACMDLLQRKGPLLTDKIAVLLVSSSKAQCKMLAEFLKSAGFRVKVTGGLEEAAQELMGAPYQAVVSDNVLPDGTAAALAQRMRQVIKANIPRFIVWTASPEKIAELANPQHHIDDVVLKPGPDAGREEILLAIILGLYQTRQA